MSAVSSSKTYLSVRHVADRFDVSPNSIWRWTANNPEFPKPIKLGPGCTRWRLSDLLAFERRRLDAPKGTPIRKFASNGVEQRDEASSSYARPKANSGGEKDEVAPPFLGSETSFGGNQATANSRRIGSASGNPGCKHSDRRAGK